MILLARLVLVRALGPGTLVPLAVLVALAVLSPWSPPAELPLTAADGAALGRALARQGVWTVGLSALVCALVWRAAALTARWRRSEGDWVGQRARGRLAALAAATLGLAAAATIGTLFVAAAAELAASRYPERAGPALRRARVLPGPELVLHPGDAPEAWRLADPRGRLLPGTRVRAELVALPGAGPTVRATLALARAGGTREERSAIVAGRAGVEVPVPPGAGELELVLSRPAFGAGLLLPEGGLSLLEPAHGELEASAALYLRALPLLVAAAAVALGFAAFVARATAAAGTLVLLLPYFAAEPRSLLPGSDLLQALEIAGAGLAPPLPSPLALAGLAVLVAAALAIGAAGLSSWRRA